MARMLLKPTLYAETEAGPILLGGRCECGFIFFPMQRFGCERCGRSGDALSTLPLRGAGTLLASTVVQVHADARRQTPFTVGIIALDDGPVIRTLLIDANGSDAQRVRVEAVVVAVSTEANRQAFDLRFRPSRAS